MEEYLRNLYLELMALTLTDIIYEHEPRRRGKRFRGKDWPERAYTMIGIKRLDNLKEAVENVLENEVPGDLVECGVWRGGACIFMKAVLAAYTERLRNVWVVDSFEGMPTPDSEKYPPDEQQRLHEDNYYLAVSEAAVRHNFKMCRLLDDRVKFLKGWFKDTLPDAPIEQIAVLRLDGDFYESTMDILVNLYDKVSPGGWIIVDDFWALPACRQAIREFRATRNITSEIIKIDWTSVYWIKEK